MSKMGKGAQIRVAAGHYRVASETELFHLLHGTIDIRGSFDSEEKFQTAEQETTILSGVPRDYTEQLRERGFFVAPDAKLTDRDAFGKVRKQLNVHQSLQLSMPAAPCVGGSVNGMACTDVDLLSHVGMADISAIPGSGADVWGFVDLNSNREYAIVAFNTGTAVFDVTDAENPREVDFIDGQTASWRDIKVYQFWNATTSRWNAQAYITTDGSTDGLFVIDLSGLPHRIQRVNFTSDFTQAHNVYATNTDFGTGLSLTGATPSIVIAGSEINSGPYRAYSIDTPSAPNFEVMPGAGANDYMHDASSMIITDGRKDTQCVNATTYCEVLFDFNENTVDIWDITATNDPQRLSSTPYPNAGYVHSGWATEDKQYLLIHDEFDEISFGLNSTVNVFDLSSLVSPNVLAPWSGPTRAIDHNGFSRGNRYYMSNYARGLTILDITDVTSIQQVGHIDTFPAFDGTDFVGAWGAYPYFHSGNIAISDIDSGFYMVADRTLSVAEGSFALASRSYGGGEGTQLQIPVQRLGGSTGSVSVAYEILGATATADDVDGGTGLLNWADGDSADKMIALDLLGDGDPDEGQERLFIKLLAPTGGATLDYQNIASVYVAEAGAASVVEFADPEVRTAERGFATAVVIVHRSGSAQGAASVEYSITGGDAIAGTDFQGPATGIINWADGDADPKWIEYTMEDDGVVEATESYELTLANVNGATIGARGTINVFVADGEGSNTAPNAVAGASQTVASGARVTLDGSGSNDPEGDSLTYQWSQISGDAVTLENASSATATFTAPTVDSDRLLRFQLTVSDGQLQNVGTVSVTVQRSGGFGNNGGGGGAVTWLLLLGLLLTARRTRLG
ncbi:MAG: choice-of-anchor B family protein [Woeseiaceae bacterium]